MSYETLLTEFDEDTGVAVIQMNRPDALNALCEAMMNDLTSALDRFEADDKVGCVILTGSRKAFSGGADVKEIKDKTFPESYYEDFISRNWERTARMRKPIIAAVAGYAVGGGCELALMCDIIIAADNARFGQTGPRVGSFDGGFGASLLARNIGIKKAKEFWFLCRHYTAEEALDMGLVNAVVPVDDLEKETVAWCREMLHLSPLSLRLLKSSFNAEEDGLTGLQQLSHDATLLFYMSEEGQEGRNAFQQGRKPDFDKFPKRP